jgi:hypothetical protein
VIAIVIRLFFRGYVSGLPALSADESTRLGRSFALLAEPGSTSGRSVVVPASADGVSHPSHQHHCQANDEEDDPDDQAKMGVGEGRKEGREEEPEDDEEDSEADHDVYLVSVDMGEADGRVSVGGRHLAWCSSDLVLPSPAGASFVAQPVIPGSVLS